MSKRYAEPIDVESSDGTIEAFRWRGKRYRVRAVLGRWRETGGWWRGEEGDPPWAAGRSCEIFRIESVPPGVFEVARDLRSGAWMLHRVWD